MVSVGSSRRGDPAERKKRLVKYFAYPAAALAISLIVSNIHHLSSSPRPDSPNRGAPPEREPLTPIVERYAPYVYASIDKCSGRQDLISNIDFDGDLIGNNDWENFDRFELIPTVYYAILETETHYFISYHLFHPRDWNHFTVWLNDTHENDGENFQVVVRKSDGRVVLLWTQAHYRSRVYSVADSGIQSGATRIDGGLQTVTSTGMPEEKGTHVCVVVESEGHGIYGTLDSASDVLVNPDGTFRFNTDSGLLFRPARDGEEVKEPTETKSGETAYQLDSITHKLWPQLRAGELTGDGKLLDGSFPYQDELVDIKEVPRFYDGNRLSGPFGSDRGISPFALDFTFKRGTLGALFFNPARRYSEQLEITGPWSQNYINYPLQDKRAGWFY
jgi:hypothetical protein